MTWATSVPILVSLGLSVLELGPMYATDRQTSDVRQKHRLMAPPIRGGGIITKLRDPRNRKKMECKRNAMLFTRSTLCIARSMPSRGVRLSHAGIVSKRLKLSLNFLTI